MLKQDADQAWCDCSEAIRGMSLRVIPMSANSRSLNWESSCMASPYRFQLWKKRITGDNMGFVLSRPFRPESTAEIWAYSTAVQYFCCSAANLKMHNEIPVIIWLTTASLVTRMQSLFKARRSYELEAELWSDAWP